MKSPSHHVARTPSDPASRPRRGVSERPSPLACFALAAATLIVSVVSAPRAAGADDDGVPGAPMLLPEDTLAYLRIADVREIQEGFAETSTGKMLQDPQMKPFASDIYRTLEDLFDQVSSAVGVGLNDLLAIPQGQVAIALVPRLSGEPDPDQEIRDDPDDESEDAIRRRLNRKRREQFGFAAVLIVEAKDNIDTVRTLVERLEQQLQKDSLIRRTETVDATKLTRWLPPRTGRPPIEYFERNGAFVIGVGDDTAGGVLKKWAGESADPTFANNNDFISVMSRSVGAEDELPQITFYVDPYHIVERLIKANGGAAALAWPLVESLGIAKIRGIGGSTFQGGEYFDDINHIHIVIDTPRDGFFGVLRPGSGETMPPNWVPGDVTTYTTVHWRFEKTLENLGVILDKFNGEGSIERFFEDPLQTRTGLSLRQEILPLLTGRYVGLRWLQPPMTLNSQTSTMALEVNDPVLAKEYVDAFRKRVPQAMKPEVIAGTMTYALGGRNGRNVPESFRQPEPTLFLLGNWIIFTDSKTMVQRMIQADAGGLPRLAGEPDYELVSGELGGKLDGETPFLISYVKASDFFRQMYELGKDPKTRKQLRRIGEDNVFARKYAELLERNQLPPFSEFEKYFGAGGIFGYDEPGGIHLGSFNLKPL